MNLETTILTSPNDGLTLQKEIRLLKSALLYSDKITLISPSLTSILYMMRLATLSDKEKLEYMRSLSKVDPSLKGDEIENAIMLRNQLTQKKGKTNEEVIKLELINKSLKRIDEYYREWGENLFMQSGLPEFYYLIENDTVRVKHLDVNEKNEDMASQILQETIQIVNKSDTYPIFDILVEQIAQIYLKQTGGEVANSSAANMNEVFVGKEFLLRLPNIDKIAFEDIIRLKTELGPELNRFKGLVQSFAKNISGIVFDKESRQEIEKKYEYQLIPELHDIQQKIESNNFFKHVARDIAENVTKYSIFLGVAGLADLQKLMLGASGLIAAETIFKSRNEVKKASMEIKNSSVYFYHKMMKL